MILSFSDWQALRFALAPKPIRSALRSALPLTALRELFALPTQEAAKRLSPQLQALWLSIHTQAQAEALVQRCEHLGVTLLLPTQEAWPERLDHLATHTPDLLYLRGTIPTGEGIALIGTRHPSPYGLRATEYLVRDLAASRAPILSGLALGIDGAAHTAALEAGLPALAVLGTSVADADIGPKSHVPLAERILEHGGGLLSELMPGEPVYKGAFPERNRLIAALCHALVVIEAQERSGTMITSRIALELGRDVLAVPGSIFSSTSRGTHRLIAAGARPCTGARDVWETLTAEPPQVQERTREKLHTNPQDQPILDACDARTDGISLDDLCLTTGNAPDELIERLSLLELQGLLRQDLAGRWRVAGLAS